MAVLTRRVLQLLVTKLHFAEASQELRCYQGSLNKAACSLQLSVRDWSVVAQDSRQKEASTHDTQVYIWWVSGY